MRSASFLILAGLWGCSGSVDDRPRVDLGQWDAAVALMWAPEGDKFGDELTPSDWSRDFVIRIGWIPGPQTPGGIKIRIAVTVVGTNHPGSCTNAGERALPDITLEQTRNAAWEIVGPDIADYPGLQTGNVWEKPFTPSARSSPLAAGEFVELRVSCYDWMGFGTLLIEVGVDLKWQGPARSATVVRFPADLDLNGLPDVLEQSGR